MGKANLKDILIDADVISHFITGGQIIVLHNIFPNKIYILDKVYDELVRFRSVLTPINLEYFCFFKV